MIRARTQAFAFAAFATAACAQQTPPKLDVPYVPTPMDVVEAMLTLAQVTGDDVVYDLGCGDGRIVVTAAKKYGAKGYGVDIDPQRIKESNASAKKEGVTDKVKFEVKDLFEMDFSEATVLTLYLLPSVNQKLRPKILELKPGTRVVSHSFDMGDWRPDKQITAGTTRTATLYYWVVPTNAAGTWTWSLPNNEEATLVLQQKYQELPSPALTLAGKAVPMRRPMLEGDKITFVIRPGEVGEQRFEGRIRGDTIVGTSTLAGTKAEWTAKRKG